MRDSLIPRLPQAIALSVVVSLLVSLPVFARKKTLVDIQREKSRREAPQWLQQQRTDDFSTSIEIQPAFPDRDWWGRFGDPALTGCIESALNASPTLTLAEARVTEAKALARQSLAEELPQVSLGATYTRQRNSPNIIPGAGGRSFGLGAGGGFLLGTPLDFFSVPLTASYEADIWQKNRDRTRAAKKQFNAVERDYQTTLIVLTTDVAAAYFNLLAADEIIDLQKRVVAVAENDLFHARNRQQAGLVSDEDVVLRQGRLSDFRAQLQDAYRLRELVLNQLAVLMGKTPAALGELSRGQWTQYAIPTSVDAGVPSELLTRRPDILAAEDRLEAAGLLARAARKELFPAITLNGQFGFSAAEFRRLFNWQSRVYSLAGSLLQPIFTGGRLRANIKAFEARYDQQLSSYQGVILQAFREVEDSLASVKASRNAYLEYEASLASLEQRLTIQKNRLAAGALAPADINPVELEALLARQGLARTKLAALTDTLSLYKALGGGF
jgi:multidrug efflux system outer membrane protein